MISNELEDEEYLAMMEDESLPPVDRVTAWLYSSDCDWPVEDTWLLIEDYHRLLESKSDKDYTGWAVYVVLALLAIGYFAMVCFILGVLHDV